ncbi:hypothetical protein EDC96DRAFT_520273 [Choanephora cucurbitarum]|nr:hypothetical protein EDC96DRAFT_520273 [Choanephora cucurbitarum]
MTVDLLSLSDQILTCVTSNLQLKDLLALADCHSRLRELVYKNPGIWTSDLLFPIGDSDITDTFIKAIVPRITRHYGILDLKMIGLPLSWKGYLMIFDQFAHSVKHIEIQASSSALTNLAHHLSIFAANLTLLQRNNKIPITFRQYAFDDEDEFVLGDSMLHSLESQFKHMKLDDPPFERLEQFRVKLEGDSTSSDLEERLRLLAFFLSGKPIHEEEEEGKLATLSYNNNSNNNNNNNNSSNSNNKRTRDECHYLPQANKHIRHGIAMHETYTLYR